MKKAFFLVCTVLCANMLVAQTFTSEGLNYEVIDDNSVRLADNNEASGEIVIPSAVIYDGNTYSVTAIGFAAFLGSGLTSVTLPNSVTEIGDNAFYDCRDLASVSLGGGITYIGENGFGACVSVSDEVIPAAERVLLENYARKFDVEENQITDFVEFLIDCAKKNLSHDEVLNELNK